MCVCVCVCECECVRVCFVCIKFNYLTCVNKIKRCPLIFYIISYFCTCIEKIN